MAQVSWMNMVYVLSPAISAVGYDAEGQRLRVRFKSGHAYDFYDVPERTFAGFLHAKNKQDYYLLRIKDQFTAHVSRRA
jgi:hypothetical protein